MCCRLGGIGIVGSFHSLAGQGPVGRTRVVGDGEATRTIEAVIDDIYTEDDAEYVRLDDDRRIRLDLIQQVDDVSRPGAC